MFVHATRLSPTVVIRSKKPTQIVNVIIKYWVALYATVEKFLRYNGDELINDKFMTLCKTLNTNINTAGAESPWYNGIVEQNSLVPSEMLNKVLEKNLCNLDIALA